MTEQTSTATCKYPGCEAIARAGGRAGTAAGVLRGPRPQQGDRMAGAETAGRR